MEAPGAFAIIDVSERATRGQILMLLDDNDAAQEVAVELSRRQVPVVVRTLNAQDLDRVRANLYAVA